MKKTHFLVILITGIATFMAIYYFMKSNNKNYSSVQMIELHLNDTDESGNNIQYEFLADHFKYNLHYTAVVKNEKQVFEKELKHEKYVQLLKMLYQETTALDTSSANALLIAEDTTYYLTIDNEKDYIDFLKLQ